MQINELNINNFVNTGLTTALPRYTFSVGIKWTDDENQPHTYGPTQHTYPNDLATMPLSVRRAFAEKMITAVIRVTLGVDSWEMYE